MTLIPQMNTPIMWSLHLRHLRNLRLKDPSLIKVRSAISIEMGCHMAYAIKAAILALSLPLISSPQSKKLSAPGRSIYQPTRIEWATLWMQAQYGCTSYSNESSIMINFSDSQDGRTLVCLVQYHPNNTAENIRITKESIETVFNIFKSQRHWGWLQLKFIEKALAVPSPN